MLRKSMALKMFSAFSIIRWNDQIRPAELYEMDKHAHKMIIAYTLSHFEEENGREVDMLKLVNAGIFEFLRRVALSDIMSPIYNKIRSKYPEKFKELSGWVFKQYMPMLDDDTEFFADFEKYLKGEYIENTLEGDILEAAHVLSSKWEFEHVLKHSANPSDATQIEAQLKKRLVRFGGLKGMNELSNTDIDKFINLCGKMRFQQRWGQTPRIPKTSVLGHMFFVGVLSFMLTYEFTSKPCKKRLVNNFFAGIFHDLAEAVTRDIINPVKRAVTDLPGVISEIEKELVEEEIYPTLPSSMREELKYYIEDEFACKIVEGGKVKSVSCEEINRKYNVDSHMPVDGAVVKLADSFSAFLETYVTRSIGLNPPEMDGAYWSYMNRYSKETKVAGKSVEHLFSEYLG